MLCDGLCTAKGEDTDFDGQKDSTETDPLSADTDGDKTTDGPEYDRMLAKNAGWGLAHDYDGDGLTDSQENFNRNATVDGNETDPYNNDTDGDLLLDGAEPSPFEDTDNDGYVNGRDQDSNHDNVNDNMQVWVAFRTNAVAGDYSGSGVWIALIAPQVNPYYPAEFDFRPVWRSVSDARGHGPFASWRIARVPSQRASTEPFSRTAPHEWSRAWRRQPCVTWMQTSAPSSGAALRKGNSETSSRLRNSQYAAQSRVSSGTNCAPSAASSRPAPLRTNG